MLHWGHIVRSQYGVTQCAIALWKVQEKVPTNFDGLIWFGFSTCQIMEKKNQEAFYLNRQMWPCKKIYKLYPCLKLKYINYINMFFCAEAEVYMLFDWLIDISSPSEISLLGGWKFNPLTSPQLIFWCCIVGIRLLYSQSCDLIQISIAFQNCQLNNVSWQ